VFEQARSLIAHTGARILEASLERERRWLATA
jgi:hypothetical protein